MYRKSRWPKHCLKFEYFWEIVKRCAWKYKSVFPLKKSMAVNATGITF